MPCAAQYFPKGSRPQIDRHGCAAQAFKTHAQANYLIKSGAQNGGEAQDVEREKQPINDQAAGCAVQRKAYQL
ncbi:hypothetical protein CSE6_038_48600 [Comamonas sp. E6]|nr:hypothetical protein CSE6_038_48600 [Comamonas sp. E6]